MCKKITEIFTTCLNVVFKIQQERTDIREINLGRDKYGEYNHLFVKLTEDRQRFFLILLDGPTNILLDNGDCWTSCWCNLRKQKVLLEERSVLSLTCLCITVLCYNKYFMFMIYVLTLRLPSVSIKYTQTYTKFTTNNFVIHNFFFTTNHKNFISGR